MKKIIILLSLFFGLGLSQVQSEFLVQENFVSDIVVQIRDTENSYHKNYYYTDGCRVYDKDRVLIYSTDECGGNKTQVHTKDYLYIIGDYQFANQYGYNQHNISILYINKNTGTINSVSKEYRGYSMDTKILLYENNLVINTKSFGTQILDTRPQICEILGKNNNLFIPKANANNCTDNPNYEKFIDFEYTNAQFIELSFPTNQSGHYVFHKNENNQLYRLYDNGVDIILEVTTFGVTGNDILKSVTDYILVENTDIIGYSLDLYNGGPIISLVSNIYSIATYTYDGTDLVYQFDSFIVTLNDYNEDGFVLHDLTDFKINKYGNITASFYLTDENEEIIYYKKNDNGLYTNTIDLNTTIPPIGDGPDIPNDTDFELPNDGSTIIGKLENLMFIITNPIAFTKSKIGTYINDKIIGPIGDYINGPEITYIIDLFTYSSDDFIEENGVTFNFVKPVFTNKLTFDIIPYSYFVEFPTDKYNFSEIERDNSVLFFVGLFHSFLYLLSKFILVSLILAPIFLLLKIVDYVTTLLNVKYNGTGNVIGLGFYIAYLVVLFAIIIAYFALLFSYVSVITLIISYLNFIIVFSVGTFGAIQHFNTINIVLTVSLASLLTATILMYVANKYAKLN